jgi:hypothetical protein
MKWYGWLILSGFVILFLWCLRYLWRGWVDINKPTPDDLLHDLNFKITHSIIGNHSELYLIKQIKELNQRQDIDKKKLLILDIKFRQRFSVLHEIDEFSPEVLNYVDTIRRVTSKKEIEALEKQNDNPFLPDMN